MDSSINILKGRSIPRKTGSKGRHLAEENAKLMKTNLWLGAFVAMVVIIQVYNLAARILE